jgi:hypothetical protein
LQTLFSLAIDLKEYIIAEKLLKRFISLTVIHSSPLYTLQRALWIRVSEDKKVTRKYFPELCNL